MSIFYRPADGVAADFIPFYWDGAYHLFYLKDYRDEAAYGKGTPWWHVVTRNFVQFDDWGEALPRGAADEPDQWVFTGSVIEHAGAFHIFYTGHNPAMKEHGRPVQTILHATSPDLRTWTKDAGFRFDAPATGYDPDDWRDPFVWHDNALGEFWMLLAARKTTGPARNRGCIALASSPDLHTWDVRDPFWAPDLYYTHECPDLFRMGDWWYLVYSTFSDRFMTHYRMSRTLAGPWLAPANDTFDGRAYYAAKTAGDGNQRFIFGWLPTREGEKDNVDNGWQWGGELVVHEILQQPDGTLAVCTPHPVTASFTHPIALSPTPILGVWKNVGNIFTSPSVGRHSILRYGDLPEECLVEMTVRYQPGTAAFGALLRADEEIDNYYQVRLEPNSQRLVIDRWPRPGDQPFIVERPLPMAPGRQIALRLLIDGTNLVVYANDRIALSCRMYDHRQGSLGLFVTEGEATFMGVAVKTRG